METGEHIITDSLSWKQFNYYSASRLEKRKAPLTQCVSQSLRMITQVKDSTFRLLFTLQSLISIYFLFFAIDDDEWDNYVGHSVILVEKRRTYSSCTNNLTIRP